MLVPTVFLRRLAVAGAFLLSLGAAQQSQAATFNVTNTNDSGTGSLRQAVLDANSDSTADSITFASDLSGTITLGGSEIPISQSVTIQGPGANTLSISGNNTSRIFNISGGGSVAINGLTLTNGDNSKTRSGSNDGGAILNSNSNLSLSDCVLNHNNGDSGGAISSVSTGNTIYSLTLTNCTFDSNRSIFRGGALYSSDMILQATGCTFSNNWEDLPTNAGSNVLGGGAIYQSHQTMTLTQCTLSGNRATTANSSYIPRGGAISTSGPMTLTNCTITKNSAPYGGGIYGTGVLSLSNTIVAGNSATTSGDDLTGTLSTNDHNLIGGDPLLGPLANNGGLTQTHAPSPDSPAIDAGNSTLTTDQRGSARPVDVASIANASDGNGSDIGAVEVSDASQSGANLVVNTSSDHDDGVCGTTDCTLREAINAANANSDTNTITFDPLIFATKQVIILPHPLPGITNTVSISGPTAPGSGVTLTAPNDTLTGLAGVKSGTASFANLTFADSMIAGITIEGGTVIVNGCTFSHCGIGIQNGEGTQTVSALTVSNSTFTGSGNSGVYTFGSNATSTVKSCTLTGNANGSYIQIGTLNLSNCIVVGNSTANVYNGGGTFNDNGHNITTGTAAQAGLDPNGLQDNGGPTQTIALVVGSPAIDAGNSTLTTDQRGDVRPFDLLNVANASDGNGSDIGAFEMNEVPQSGPNFVVNKTNDRDDSVCGPTDCTLREAINAANANSDSSTITFDATVFAAKTTIVLTNGALPIITSNLSITGPVATGAGITIQNTSASASSGKTLDVESGTVAISNLTLIGGDYGLYTAGNGTTVNGCTFTTNNIGIQNNGGILTVNNSTLAGNTNVGISISFGSITGNYCTIADNGTGIYNDSSTFNLSSYLVSRNNSGFHSIGLGVGGTLADCLIIGNNSDNSNPFPTNPPQQARLDPDGLQDNGGPTKTIALLIGSSAIDIGRVSGAPSTDQRGVVRDSKPDIGAFEFVNIAPVVVSVSPQGMSDKVGAKRTFTLVMSDRNGAGDIREMWLLINRQLDWNDGATLIYRPSATSPTDGQLFLRSGDNFLSPITIGTGASSSAVLDNGAVRVVATDVSVSVSGNAITLTLPLTIRDGLVGQNGLFARAQDSAGAVDLAAQGGDSGFVRAGSYTVTAQFAGATNNMPTLSKLTPGATNTTLGGSGIAPAAQSFGFFVQDGDGIGDIESVWFLANKARGSKNSATFIYYPRTRRLVLRSDDDTSVLGGGKIGTPGIIENSQVRVDLSKVKLTIANDGKSLGLTLPLQAKSGLIGSNKVWLRVQDTHGATSPDGDDLGFVPKGTWNVKASTAADTKPSNGNS